MKHFLIYTNKHKDQELATTKRIRNYLESKGCTVKLKVKESDWKAETESAAEEEATDIPLDVDCMIVLGGDGTVLQAARETKKILVPIIGVNLGTVGYMTEIEPSGLEEALERLIRDDRVQHLCQRAASESLQGGRNDRDDAHRIYGI